MSESFERQLRINAAGRPHQLILDCAALGHIVSNHITLLWKAKDLCQTGGIDLKLLNPPVALLRMLYVLDLVHLFQFEGTRDLESWRADKDLLSADFPRSYSDRVSVVANDIDAAIDRFASFLSNLGVGTLTALELKTVFYEIATNIRCHSNLGPTDQFTIDTLVDENGLTITFIDPGRAFDMTAVNDNYNGSEAARKRQRRGFGLPLIRRLTNRIEYRRHDGTGNILTIGKNWRR